jgi:hypothetical protein
MRLGEKVLNGTPQKTNETTSDIVLIGSTGSSIPNLFSELFSQWLEYP